MKSAYVNGIDAHVVHISSSFPTHGPHITIDGPETLASYRKEVTVIVSAALKTLAVSPERTRLHVSEMVRSQTIDLALALTACFPDMPHVAALGGLLLNGKTTEIRGAFPCTKALAKTDITDLIVAHGNLREVQLVLGDMSHINVHPVHSLSEAVKVCESLSIQTMPNKPMMLIESNTFDSRIKARNMLSDRPVMTNRERMEVAQIYSSCGITIPTERPLRVPHHTTSAQGMIGGGSKVCRPGELSLAQHGILLLLDITEFPLETLRMIGECVKEKKVVFTSSKGPIKLPVNNVWVIASTPPCPCGHKNTPKCVCTTSTLKQFDARISNAKKALGI